MGQGALLRDIGKIGLPDSLLQKPGALSDGERQTMQAHTVLGEQIIAPLRSTAALLPIIRHHHERWDGKGYPFGLQGEETPFLARLVAVADAFSAMTMDRPYRKGMDREKALSVLEEGAGTQWDPECVWALLRAYSPTATLALAA